MALLAFNHRALIQQSAGFSGPQRDLVGNPGRYLLPRRERCSRFLRDWAQKSRLPHARHDPAKPGQGGGWECSLLFRSGTCSAGLSTSSSETRRSFPGVLGGPAGQAAQWEADKVAKAAVAPRTGSGPHGQGWRDGSCPVMLVPTRAEIGLIQSVPLSAFTQ